MSSERTPRARMFWRGFIWIGVVAGIGMSVTSARQNVGSRATPRASVPPGWHALGAATWRADNGEFVATVPDSGDGGWLVSDLSYQDLRVQFSFRCAAECQPGVLFGMEKSGDSDSGLFVSLGAGDLGAYDLTVDARGKELARRKYESAVRGGGGGRAAAAAGGAGSGAAGAARAGGAAASGGRGAGGGRGSTTQAKQNEWNAVEARLYVPLNGMTAALQVLLNTATVSTGYPAATIGPPLDRTDRIGARPEIGRFGPLAIRVSGAPGAEIRFKDLSILNYTEIVSTPLKMSNRFRLQQVQPYFLGDGGAVGDLNHDGILDVVSGTMYWQGPDFKRGREIDVTRPMDITDYARALGQEVADFTGDGWADVIGTAWPGGGPMYLYVNPHNELRRWPRFKVLDYLSEHFVLADLDGDRKPEIVFGIGGYCANYAKPDPSDATKPWLLYHITEPGDCGTHGIGTGDINGDGRPDVVRARGWWENPGDPTKVPWTFHPAVLGRTNAGAGGAQMQVYDVNGDKLNDVVASLEAHQYGLAWYEQKRDAAGAISFVEHIIMDRDHPAHGVSFTEPHGMVAGDIDGDGLIDIVTGKNKYNYLGHWEYNYPDEDGDGVLYWFKLVRLPGGKVDFVPHLIHNDSGLSRQPRLADLNGDGVLDIINNGRFGTMLFFGKKGATD